MTTWGDPVPHGKKDADQERSRSRGNDEVGEKLRRDVVPLDPDTPPAAHKDVAGKPEGGADSQKK